MTRLTRIAALAALALAVLPRAGAAQEACGSYRIAPGDTLRKIATRAYGSDDFDLIYEANASVIGSDPNLIEVGMALRIPCADGAPEAVPGEEEEPAVISFVTGNGYPPYTDESLPGNGMFTTLVETAMMRAAPEMDYEIIFVNDWAAHLEALLPSMAFDASFPWPEPDCATPGALSESDRYACENYLYSMSFYDIVDGFFARKGSGYDTTQRYIELRGAAICRPEGYSTSHLEAVGLMPPVVELVRPVSVEECFDELMFGNVDIVSLDTQFGDDTLADLGLSNDVAENPNLSAVKSLQVATHKDNPSSTELVEALNRGLVEMRESGEWYHIVSTALQAQVEMRLN